MEEVFFTDEWWQRSTANIHKYSAWLSDLVGIVPPSLFSSMDKICRYHNACRGGFPRDTINCIIKWSLSANLLAPGRDRLANIGILDNDELESLYIDKPMSFSASFHIQLDYNLGTESKTEVITSFTPNLINGLRARTFLNDHALHSVLDEAIQAMPVFNGAVMSWVRNQFPNREAQFVFDKAIRSMVNLLAAYDNNKHNTRERADTNKKLQDLYSLLRSSSKSMTAIASRIEKTKSFSKSRVLEKIRKDAEQEAIALVTNADKIYCGECYYDA